jgi:hypothetical protein
MSAAFESFFAGFGPLEWLLWLVGAVALAFFLLPFAAGACVGTVVRFRATFDPAAAQPDGSDAEYEEKYHELLALGFRPCGYVTESTWFTAHHLHRTTRVRKLVSEDGKTYASLYRLGEGGLMLRVAFASLTENGCLVQTAFPGAGISEDSAVTHRTEVPEGTVADVYSHHLNELDAVSAHNGPAQLARLNDVAKADERYSAHFLARCSRAEGLWSVGIAWGQPFAACLIGLALLSSMPWAQLIGWSMVFAALCYAFWVVKVLPFLLRISEQMPDGSEEEAETAAEE